jgi:hypothetical protein
MFFVVEGARAMWILNSLNNAARIGARVAAVDADLEEALLPGEVCSSYDPDLKAVDAVCSTPEARKTAEDPWSVAIDIREASGVDKGVPAEEGDVVHVRVSTPFSLFAPTWILHDVFVISSSASMRYE